MSSSGSGREVLFYDYCTNIIKAKADIIASGKVSPASSSSFAVMHIACVRRANHMSKKNLFSRSVSSLKSQRRMIFPMVTVIAIDLEAITGFCIVRSTPSRAIAVKLG